MSPLNLQDQYFIEGSSSGSCYLKKVINYSKTLLQIGCMRSRNSENQCNKLGIEFLLCAKNRLGFCRNAYLNGGNNRCSDMTSEVTLNAAATPFPSRVTTSFYKFRCSLVAFYFVILSYVIVILFVILFPGFHYSLNF